MIKRTIAHFGFAVLIVCSSATSLLAASPAPIAEKASYQLNDRVQTNVNGLGWITGTVIEIGKGDQEGKVKVHADGYRNDFWVRATMTSAIRKVAGAAPAPASTPDQLPRLGKYLIQSYGASANPLHLGYFELRPGMNYRFLDMGGNVTGDGRYEYDGQAKEVRWMSGPLLANKWGGKFEASREGKTHSIRFTRTTFGTNSTDSK